MAIYTLSISQRWLNIIESHCVVVRPITDARIDILHKTERASWIIFGFDKPLWLPFYFWNDIFVVAINVKSRDLVVYGNIRIFAVMYDKLSSMASILGNPSHSQQHRCVRRQSMILLHFFICYWKILNWKEKESTLLHPTEIVRVIWMSI